MSAPTFVRRPDGFAVVAVSTGVEHVEVANLSTKTNAEGKPLMAPSKVWLTPREALELAEALTEAAYTVAAES